MGFGQPSFDEDSPLDTLASTTGSRASVASSISTGSGILDAFPLPPGIETFPQSASVKGLHDSKVSSKKIIKPHKIYDSTSDDDNSLDSPVNSHGSVFSTTSLYSADDQEKNTLGSMHGDVDELLINRTNPTDNNPDKQDRQLKRTQKRYLRYGRSFETRVGQSEENNFGGHTHSASFNGFSYTVPSSPNPLLNSDFSDEKPLPRPNLIRMHSVSRSWDAGGGAAASPELAYTFPKHNPNIGLGNNTPDYIPRLGSSQEHIEFGCHALMMNHIRSAYLHWTAAASPPFNDPNAILLLELGKSQKWFYTMLPYHFPSDTLKISTINTVEFKKYIGLISIQVRDALNNLGSLLKRAQDNINAVSAFELSGNLGSKDGLLSAANIYYKGCKGVRKDVSRARKLYDRASTL